MPSSVRFNGNFKVNSTPSQKKDYTFDMEDTVPIRGRRNEDIDDGNEEGDEEVLTREEDEMDLPIFEDGTFTPEDLYAETETFQWEELTADSTNRGFLSAEDYLESLREEGMLDQLGRNYPFSYDERFLEVVESELKKRLRKVSFEEDDNKKARVREVIALYARNPEKHPDMTPEKLEKLRSFCGMSPNELHHLTKPKPKLKPLTNAEQELLFRRFNDDAPQFFEEMMEEFLPEGADLKAEEKLLENSGAIWEQFNKFWVMRNFSKKRNKFVKYKQERLQKRESIRLKKLDEPISPEKLKEEETMSKVNPFGLPNHRLNGFGVYFPHILEDFPRDHVTWPLMYDYARVLSKNPTFSQNEKEKILKDFKSQFLQVDVEALKAAYKKMGLPTTFENYIIPQDDETWMKWEDFMEENTLKYIKNNGFSLDAIHKRIVNNASDEVLARAEENAVDESELYSRGV